MTILHADKLTHIEISPDSQWEQGLDKFVDWEPHSNGQLFITHVDPNPPTYHSLPYTDPRDNEGHYSGEVKSTLGEMLDDLPIAFGKKYPDKTPNELMEIDPQYIVWCRENTSRVFCSDKLYREAKRICAGKKGLMK